MTGISLPSGGVTVVLNGNNTITIGGPDSKNGLVSQGAMTLRGSGKLTVDLKEGAPGAVTGIMCSGGTAIIENGVTIEIISGNTTGNNTGISVSNFNIEGGTITVNLGNSSGSNVSGITSGSNDANKINITGGKISIKVGAALGLGNSYGIRTGGSDSLSVSDNVSLTTSGHSGAISVAFTVPSGMPYKTNTKADGSSGTTESGIGDGTLQIPNSVKWV